MSSCNSEENISTQIYYLHLFIKQRPIFFQEWHENKRIILSFPQSAMLLQCQSKLVKFYFGNIIVFEIVLTEQTDQYFLFCMRQIFSFKHVSVTTSTRKFPNRHVNSTYSSTQPLQGQGLALCLSPGTKKKSPAWARVQSLPHSQGNDAPDSASALFGEVLFGTSHDHARQLTVLGLFSLPDQTQTVMVISCFRFNTSLSSFW